MAMPKGDRRGRRRGALEEDGSATCETLELPEENRWERRPGNQPPTRRRHDGCADGRPSEGAPRRTSPVPRAGTFKGRPET